jgi:beta-mannosidase
LVERLELAAQLARHGKAAVYLQLWLDQGGERVARNTAFFTAPRFMDLPRERLRPRVKRLEARTFELTFQSRTFQHQVECELPGATRAISDDYFDLFPGTPHRVVLETKRDLEPAKLRAGLVIRALADSY